MQQSLKHKQNAVNKLFLIRLDDADKNAAAGLKLLRSTDPTTVIRARGGVVAGAGRDPDYKLPIPPQSIFIRHLKNRAVQGSAL